MTSTMISRIDSIALPLREKMRGVHQWWLHASIILYFIVLPFNAFGLVIPFVGYRIKYTELALLLIVFFAVFLYRRQSFYFVRARWLYGFLLLHAVAQFVSLLKAHNLVLGFDVAIAAASYSILVFILVNIVRSEAMTRAILTVMGIIAVAVVVITYGQYFFRDGLHPGQEASILGINQAHYMAYFLVMYGSGFVYIFVRSYSARWARWAMIFVALLWADLILLTSVKIASLVAMLFLVLLVVTLKGARHKALLLCTVFFLLFVFRFYIVPIKNAALEAQYSLTSTFFTFEHRVAQGFKTTALLLQTKLGTKRIASSRDVSTTPPSSPTPSTPPSSPTPSTPPSSPTPSTPPSLPPPVPINVYSEENRAQRRWVGGQLSGSVKIRQRGIAVGWLMGRIFPFTGIGAGQTQYAFDEFTEKARIKARDLSPNSLGRYFFVDEVIPASNADKGIFNIFMNAWAETGILGILAVIGIFVTVFVQGIVALWKTKSMSGMQPIRIFFPLFLALTLYHQTIYLWIHPWLWTILALTYISAHHSLHKTENPL